MTSPLAACVRYNATIMARTSDLAFDGTIVRVGRTSFRPSIALATTTVDFRVHEWFDGGSQRHAVRILVPTGGVDRTAPPFGPGTRLLVSGFTRQADGPPGDYAAGCGFTRYYEPAVAAEWSHAEARLAQRTR